MTVYNFNWFLHSLLFLHTQRIINKQKEEENRKAEGIEEEEDDDDDDEGIDIEEEE